MVVHINTKAAYCGHTQFEHVIRNTATEAIEDVKKYIVVMILIHITM